jgi:HSP20 family protein
MAFRELVENVKHRVRRAKREAPGTALQVSQGARLEQLGDRPLAAPCCDVFESEEEIVIVADVPGAAKEGTVVSWDERAGLTLFARNQTEAAERPWAAEFLAQDWHRVFALPALADGARATSSLKNGVLTVRVPKRAAATKVIPLTAE